MSERYDSHRGLVNELLSRPTGHYRCWSASCARDRDMLMPRGSSRTRSIRTNASWLATRASPRTRLRSFPKVAFRSGPSVPRSRACTFSRVSCTSSLRSWTTGIPRYSDRDLYRRFWLPATRSGAAIHQTEISLLLFHRPEISFPARFAFVIANIGQRILLLVREFLSYHRTMHVNSLRSLCIVSSPRVFGKISVLTLCCLNI